MKKYHKIGNYVAVYIQKDQWIISKGYNLFKYNPRTGEKIFFASIEDTKNKILSKFRLTRRLFRAEIAHMYHWGDTWMCIAKKGIFKYEKEKKTFIKCCNIEKGSRPMCLCQSKCGNIYYGEYCFNPNRKPMRIFQSKDMGDTWEVVYTFENDEINHIHGIFQDPYTDRLWVATGDDDKACIFGYTEDEFKTFVRKYEGKQQYRVCVPLFTKDEIIFATDSQYEQNVIRSINRETGEIKDLCKIQGSGIYAAQSNRFMLISTTVEPSKVNLDKSSHLWYSFDGHNWSELVSYKKDFWHTVFFQFGSIRFPNYEGDISDVVFSGRSLKHIDQSTLIISIENLK